MGAKQGFRIAAAAVLAMALGGCLGGLGGGKPPATLLRLSSDAVAPAGSAATARAADAIMVIEPETDRHLAVLRVPVLINAVDIAYIKDMQWVERPSRQFRDLLAERLRARGGRLVLEDDQPVPATGQRLGGRLVEMGYDSARGVVVVRYDALRTGPRGDISTRRFEASERVGAATPALIGPALNRAANAVAGQVADWIG